MGTIHKYLIALKHVAVALLIVVITIGAIHFPNDVDAPLTQQEVETARKYYTDAYQKPVTESQATSEHETEYIRVAEAVEIELLPQSSLDIFQCRRQGAGG